jgi:molybdopterin-containing oxidoreductase family iron-sulfur binding subunit
MNPRKDLAPKLADLQQRLGDARGKQFWRTLEEAADTEAFQELLRQEFPDQALEPGSMSRRRFLTLMGASLALAGVSGCSVRPAPSGTMVPYVRAPEEVVAGRPLFFATAMTLGGCGVGLLVESHMGRPTKVEGNPDHPASLGATDLFHQASILTLYDPDRSQTVTHLGQTGTWEDAVAALRTAMERQRPERGSGLRLLTETVVSPTLAAQIQALLRAFPEAKWHQYEPLAQDNAYRGMALAFNKPVKTYYRFRDLEELERNPPQASVNTYYRFHDFEHNVRLADVVLALDCDFLASGTGNLRYTAEFMAGRRVRTTSAGARQAQMNRLYVVEPGVSCTGAKADHRLAVPAAELETVARAIASRLGVQGAGGGAGPHSRWVDAVAHDLNLPAHRGRCVVLAGDRQPPAVHLLAHVLNHRLGNVGHTVFHTDSIAPYPVDEAASLADLVEDMQHDRVKVLVILGGNPVYTAPVDLAFREHLDRVPLRFHLSLYQDETSRYCQWHLPETHYLEAWSDTRAFDGTESIAQPLIAPLYSGVSAHEVLAVMEGSGRTPGYEILRASWRRRRPHEADFERFWQTAVHDGVVANTRFPPRNVSLDTGWQTRLPAAAARSGSEQTSYELVFEADPTLLDGRFANNGWLQELPKPMTKLTWDNAALMSPATAHDLGVGLGSYAHGGEHGGYHPDVVELRLGERTVRAPIWIVPGHADRSITVHLGYGRASAGRVGGTSEEPVGFNAYLLRTRTRPWFAWGLSLTKTGRTAQVTCTQQHHLMENRHLIRSATLGHYQRTPAFAAEPEEEELREQTRRGARRPLTLYEPPEPPSDEARQRSPHKWGMAIDLTTCTGCSACVVACQAENNIPVVGKEQVSRGREMHWLRIDRYTEGPANAPREIHFQPVPCMHCEQAPCEYVCPVEATVHSADGLNDMIYQRCVGTRFCSNNCPYKVRRFNFFFFADYATQSVRQQYNPNVTVRSRGVMEKCTYCVQRIRRAEIDSQVEGRSIADGEILTACQAACPASAIVFGDLNDQGSTVRHWKDTPLNYGLLTELNTRPRTTYLAALRNPNPELEAE